MQADFQVAIIGAGFGGLGMAIELKKRGRHSLVILEKADQVGGAWRVLEPGMVMTVEPGLYIAPDNMDVDPKWRGIGVRIEDDVVVTKEGCRVLTDAVPKNIAEVEALMAE